MAAIGLAHPHVFGMVQSLSRAGGELVAYVPEPHRLGEAFAKQYPDADARTDHAAILEDDAIELVLGAGIPAERAALGIDVVRHGKDYVSDKPGFTTLEQVAVARRATAETGRRFVVWFSERLDSRATVRAGELVRAGAIGRVVHTLGLGPHRLDVSLRPSWFFERARYGGILTDLASHQMDQFLHLTGTKEPKIEAARVANRAHPEHPELQDFGEVLLEAEGTSGYTRVDWFTPDGLASWGDGRLFVLGTEGQLEVRKNVDLAGREGGDHLFLVDRKGTRHVDCSADPLAFGAQLLQDVTQRTENAVTQDHCFLASELALQAQAMAEAEADG